MSIGDIVSLMQGAVWQVFTLCAPVLGAALIVGLIVAIFQATTSIQEQTLIFIPKILAVCLCIVLLSPWISQRMLVMTREILGQLERFIQ